MWKPLVLDFPASMSGKKPGIQCGQVRGPGQNKSGEALHEGLGGVCSVMAVGLAGVEV